SESIVFNAEDLPADLSEALTSAPAQIVQCATCRRLCICDQFVWNERQVCAWDYHLSVFGKRGPWRDGPYEQRLFETLPSAAYVSPPLLEELRVEVVLATGPIDESIAHSIINLAMQSNQRSPHLAVRTAGGFTLLRELPAARPL
nr:hypothetical protein [Candidatus Eremiobacteraeota bacterium]